MDFSFMHGADLHLGSTLSGLENLPEVLEKRIRDASLRSLAKLVDFCIDQQVDFLLLAGDLFEISDPSIRVQKYFARQMQRLAKTEILVFIVTGNHDRDVFTKFVFPLPKTVHVLSTEVDQHAITLNDEHEVTISGMSYGLLMKGASSFPVFPLPKRQQINIGLFHCDVGGSEDSLYYPVDLSRLQQSGFDYWALGHVHTNRVWDTTNLVVYPGVMQGRNRQETGPKGCYYVTCASQNLQAVFYPFQDIMWENRIVDLSDVTIDQLYAVIADVKEKSRQCNEVGVLLQIILTGFTPCHHALQMQETLHDLIVDIRVGEEQRGDGVWIHQIKDQTLPVLDWGKLENRNDFLGELLSFVATAIDDPTLHKELEKIWSTLPLREMLFLDRDEILNRVRVLAVQLFGGEQDR